MVSDTSLTISRATRAGTRDIETVATTCGLTRLLDLDLDSPRLHSTAASGDARAAGVLAVASHSPRHEEPLALARAAAALQRLVVRWAERPHVYGVLCEWLNRLPAMMC